MIHGGQAALDGEFALGPLSIITGKRVVLVNGDEIQLSTGEFDLLLALAERAGQAVSRDDLCRHLRGLEYDGLNRSVDIRVARLRRKLGERGRRSRMIKSIHGVGYMLARQ